MVFILTSEAHHHTSVSIVYFFFSIVFSSMLLLLFIVVVVFIDAAVSFVVVVSVGFSAVNIGSVGDVAAVVDVGEYMVRRFSVDLYFLMITFALSKSVSRFFRAAARFD